MTHRFTNDTTKWYNDIILGSYNRVKLNCCVYRLKYPQMDIKALIFIKLWQNIECRSYFQQHLSCQRYWVQQHRSFHHNSRWHKISDLQKKFFVDKWCTEGKYWSMLAASNKFMTCNVTERCTSWHSMKRKCY